MGPFGRGARSIKVSKRFGRTTPFFASWIDRKGGQEVPLPWFLPFNPSCRLPTHATSVEREKTGNYAFAKKEMAGAAGRKMIERR